MKKKKILTFCGYYLPGYKAGGPIRTIANMVELLSDDFDFYIVTGDRDALDKEPYAHLCGARGWREVGKAKVLYLSPKEKTFKNIWHIISNTPHDFLYLNSFFSYDFSVKPLILKRLGLVPNKTTVLAPRGEFSEGALSLKSKKKRVFKAVSRLLGLHRDLRWHTSSCYEREDVVREIRLSDDAHVYVAVNLPDVSSLLKKLKFTPRDKDVPLRIAFLSRISPKKNLDYAATILGNVRESVVFHIYGAANDKQYYEDCLALLSKAEDNLQYEYKGLLDHDKVVETLSGYDLFFLPTKGENFGHVILESLTAGVPVLVSDTTPWQDLEEHDAGWVLPLDKPDQFVQKIEHMAALTPNQQLAKRERVIAYAKRFLLNEENIEDNKDLFRL